MAFMNPEIRTGHWIRVEHALGTDFLPGDLFSALESLTPEDVLDYTDARDVDDVEEIVLLRNRIGVRLSASGYMDATEWDVCDSLEEARERLADLLDMGDGTDVDGNDVDAYVREVLPDDEATFQPTRVEFVRATSGEEWETAPIAVFPDLDEFGGLVLTYAHVGQHGAWDPGLLLRTPDRYAPARRHAPDVDALREELERVGYVLAEDWTVWTAGEDGLDEETLP